MYDVKVNIDLAKPIGTVGFGVPLILMENAGAKVPYTVVSNLDELVDAGITAETIAYKAAQLNTPSVAPASYTRIVKEGGKVDPKDAFIAFAKDKL